jgi:transcriptional regulator with XRE-family HTH domain
MGDVPASLLSTLGENLMRARLSAGLSREQTGLEPSLLSKYERGLIVPGLMNLVWLCEKYDVAIDDIIDVAAWVDAARETRG